jgi:hypothetical protein
MTQFTIPSNCVISKNTSGGLVLLVEEPSKFYDNDQKMGYFKVLIPRDGKFYSNGLFCTRLYTEVFKTPQEAKAHKYCFLEN